MLIKSKICMGNKLLFEFWMSMSASKIFSHVKLVLLSQLRLKIWSLFPWKVDEYALEFDLCWLILRRSPTLRSLIFLLRVALATIHLEINSAFRKYVCDMTKGFIELFTFMSVILHNKSARVFVSISTRSSFSLSLEFLTKMFPELYFRRRS